MRQRAERAKLRRMQPAVYILASQTNGTLYVGCTSNLVQRVGQHGNIWSTASRTDTV